ncbi:MAG: adenylate kinase [Kiritimatiellaceae bacterium]|nr:adenylate kinase [Kiritimatiellaceae bacterium]
MQAIVLIGGPGAGKGTLSEILAQKTDFIHVSTGDMFRAAMQSKTAVGLEAQKYIDVGSLVPDTIVLKMVEDWLNQAGADAHVMFDGFPRTVVQAEGLNELFLCKKWTLSHVFNLAVSRDLLIPRLTGRRVCKQCGAVYHVLNRPSRKEGICDVDQGELYQRADDQEVTILNRLDVYDRQTAPLIAYYEQNKLLVTINAVGSPEQIAEVVLKEIRA